MFVFAVVNGVAWLKVFFKAGMNLLTKGALPCQLNFKPLAKRGQSRPWGLEKHNSCGHGIGSRQVEWFTPQCLVGSFWHLVCFFGLIYMCVEIPLGKGSTQSFW